MPPPSPWDVPRGLAVALGGAAGAALRWATLAVVEPRGEVPWLVIAINLAGSVLLGMLLAEEWSHPRARLLLHDAGGIGFCGGLTTFSTFAVDVADLLRAERVGTAVAVVVIGVVTSCGGVVLGAASLRRVRAVTLPLEEEP